MAARAAYNGINWPVFENAAKKNVYLTVFHVSARGPGPKPISDEKCKVDIFLRPLFDFEKNIFFIFFPDSLPTYWDFESRAAQPSKEPRRGVNSLDGKVKRIHLNTPRYEYSDVYTHMVT